MGLVELSVVVFAVLSVLVVLWPATRICMRMGFSPWLMLLAFVPIGNLVLLWYFAYADWPSEPGSTDRPRRVA